MELNKANYYSNEADWHYMSVSQYKDFVNCEARALAKLKKEWDSGFNSKALVVGNYVHSYFEDAQAHKEFIEENKSVILKKNGDLYSEFVQADEMIKALEKDNFFNFVYQGEKEIILKKSLFGTEWKARIDCFNLEKGYLVDLKTTRSLSQRYWSNEIKAYVSFVEEYGYIAQMAVYKTLLELTYGKDVTPYIFAVTKESPADIAAIEFHPTRFEIELEKIQERLPRILAVKKEELEPSSCGKCDYCRSKKQLTGFIEVADLLE